MLGSEALVLELFGRDVVETVLTGAVEVVVVLVEVGLFKRGAVNGVALTDRGPSLADSLVNERRAGDVWPFALGSWWGRTSYEGERRGVVPGSFEEP